MAVTVTEQHQQLVDVLRAWQAAYPHVVVRNPDGVDQFAEEVALVVEEHLAAGSRGVVGERQQLAEAIRGGHSVSLSGRSWEAMAAAVEPFLVAAERAGYEQGQREDAAILEFGEAMSQARSEGRAEGYERCKQDAATAIKALWLPSRADVLAALAALNATQQEASGAVSQETKEAT
jgi:hypothetical protein